MLARVHTRQGCLTCPIGGGTRFSASCTAFTSATRFIALQPTGELVGPVGCKAMNRVADVKAVQLALNRVPPPMGGPAKLLAVDGDCGAETKAAIEAFQLKHFGWKDGVVMPQGPTHTKLQAIGSAFGPQAAGAPDPTHDERLKKRIQRANQHLPKLRDAAMDAIATATAAVTFVDNGFLAHIDALGPRNAFRIVDRYFEFGSQPALVTRAELQFILKMCRRVASTIAVRLGEIHGTPMGMPLFAADRTASKFYAYTPRHTEPSPAPILAGHIYLCD
jgi:hypothetical protein